MFSAPATPVTVLAPSVTDNVPSDDTVIVRLADTLAKSSVSTPAPVFSTTADSAPIRVSLPEPVTTFSIPVMPPAYVAVPDDRSTVTPAASADRSSVSEPAPPDTEDAAPPASTKLSAPEPPERFSMFEKTTPPTEPEPVPVTVHVESASGPMSVSEPDP